MTYSMPLHTRYGTSHTGTENLAVNPSKGHWRCPWSWTITGAVHGANMHLPRCSCFGSHEALCLGNTICPVQTHAVRVITHPRVLGHVSPHMWLFHGASRGSRSRAGPAAGMSCQGFAAAHTNRADPAPGCSNGGANTNQPAR